MTHDTLDVRFRRRVPQKPPRVGSFLRHFHGHIRGTTGTATAPASSPKRQRGRGVTVHDPGARYQRVVVKMRIVTPGGGPRHGFRSLLASTRQHVAYIAREGVALDGDRGQVYTAQEYGLRPDAFVTAAGGDVHQFRLMVSPEEGSRIDLTTLSRDLMAQMQQDLGTRVAWIAVNHYNTEHPHAHILIRGVDEDGQVLRIRGDYIGAGIRYRAMECATMQLGYRKDLEQAQARTPTQTPQVRQERGLDMEVS